jgi:hypothetical protein
MTQPTKEKADKAKKVGKVPSGGKKAAPHWFLQESDIYDFETNPAGDLVHEGRYLKIYASSMAEVNGELTFYDEGKKDEPPKPIMHFPVGSWAYMEHGFEESEEGGENVNAE